MSKSHTPVLSDLSNNTLLSSCKAIDAQEKLLNSVADPDPGSGANFTPGFGYLTLFLRA